MFTAAFFLRTSCQITRPDLKKQEWREREEGREGQREGRRKEGKEGRIEGGRDL